MSNRRRQQQDRNLSLQVAVESDGDDISEDGKRIIAALREEINSMKSEFLEQLHTKNNQIEGLVKEVEMLRGRVGKLEERVEDAEAYERRDTLVMSGKSVPPVVAGENCVSLVCNMMKNTINLNVLPSDISTAHRVGTRPNNQQVDNRSIIIKLCRRDIKRDILNACRQFKPDFFVNESLTPTRNSIMYVLRNAKKKPNSKVVGCSSDNGRVFAWVRPSDGDREMKKNARIPVNTYSQLVAFCRDTLNEPLSNYIANWRH